MTTCWRSRLQVACSFGPALTISSKTSRAAAHALATGDADFELNPYLGSSSGDRAVGNALMKGLEFFNVRVDEGAATKLAHSIESNLKLGLRRLSGDPIVTLSDAPDGTLGEKKALIFIHGTGSSTEGSYKALWFDWANTAQRASTFWETIRGEYRENIFA